MLFQQPGRQRPRAKALQPLLVILGTDATSLWVTSLWVTSLWVTSLWVTSGPPPPFSLFVHELLPHGLYGGEAEAGFVGVSIGDRGDDGVGLGDGRDPGIEG